MIVHQRLKMNIHVVATMETLCPRIVFFLAGGLVKVSAEHTQTQPPPYTRFHVRFLDPQFSGSVIYGVATSTNRVFLAPGLA